jgi:hypothetical protein
MNLLWAIVAPNGHVDHDSSATSRRESWRKFCFPALKKSAYLKDGWRAKKMTKAKLARTPSI